MSKQVNSKRATGKSRATSPFGYPFAFLPSAGAGIDPVLLAPAIMMMRWPILMMEAASDTVGTGGKRPETDRAVDEKVSAFQRGIVDMNMSLMMSSMEMATAMFWGGVRKSDVKKAANKAIAASLKPTRKTLRSNYNRLRKGG